MRFIPQIHFKDLNYTSIVSNLSIWTAERVLVWDWKVASLGSHLWGSEVTEPTHWSVIYGTLIFTGKWTELMSCLWTGWAEGRSGHLSDWQKVAEGFDIDFTVIGADKAPLSSEKCNISILSLPQWSEVLKIEVDVSQMRTWQNLNCPTPDPWPLTNGSTPFH